MIDVTVFCLTYNHGKYIKDTLEGFLNQKTNYTFKVFVYDDASTDGTSAILREYASKYPNVFDVYIAPENMYQHSTPEKYAKYMNDLYKDHICGRYVAWCEGDDYWSDADKLQLQIGFMDRHPECSMTAHASLWLDFQKNEEREFHPFREDRFLSEEEIILQPTGNLSTASLVMKRDVFMKGENFPLCDVGDVPMQLSALNKGKIYYFNRVMSVYRYMHESSWSATTGLNYERAVLHNYNMVRFYEVYDKYTDGRFHELIRKRSIYYMECVFRVNESVADEEYYNICEFVKKRAKENYEHYLKKQQEVRDIVKKQIMTGLVMKEIKKYKHIVIMGVGKYSHYISSLLQKNSIYYDGYVVTNLQDNDTQKKDNLWELGKCPFDKAETIVIVGISQVSEKSVINALKLNGIHNYIMPLWTY